MGIKSSIIQKSNLLKTMARIPSYFWSKKIIEYNLDLSQIDFSQYDDRLFVREAGIKIGRDKHDFILQSVNFIRELKDKVGMSLRMDNDEVYAKVEDVTFNIQTWEEFLILKEIYIDGIYNIITPNPIVILDIGMNTGFASLFFASQPHVLSVLSYEPLERTYNQALNNFILNSEIAKKIKPHNFGLSNSTETLTVDYCYEFKGSVGVDGLAGWIDTDYEVTKESLSLVSISEVTEHIFQNFPGVDIFAKIDCEGSEYKIIEALSLSRQLGKLKGILVEWHDCQRNSSLKNCLLEARFSIISLTPHSKTIGMIYASRL